MKNKPLLVFILIAVVLVGASYVYSQRITSQYNEGIELSDHVLGNPEAPVLLEEFSDFQCPACRAAAPIVKDIVEMYEGDLRFEYRHFPLSQIHPYALPAARAAEAAGVQGKFFEYHDRLFEEQDTWSGAGNPVGFFKQYAEELGLDMTQFSRQMDASVITDRIRADFEEGRERGVRGTPSFFLNGSLIEFDSYESLIAQIDQAVSVAKGETGASGTTTIPAPQATDGPEIRFGI